MSDIEEMRRALLVAQTALQLALAGIEEGLIASHELIKANPCWSCGASAGYCDANLFGRRKEPCCSQCALTDTHDMTMEDWTKFRALLRETP